MAAGDVSALMRNDADDFVRRFSLQQRACVYENVSAVDHESVEGVVADDANRDAAAAESCRGENRLRVVLQQCLDLGIANERQALRACPCHERRERCQQHAES